MRPTATKSYMNVTLKPTRKSLFNLFMVNDVVMLAVKLAIKMIEKTIQISATIRPPIVLGVLSP
jgi:hypothetical protein